MSVIDQLIALLILQPTGALNGLTFVGQSAAPRLTRSAKSSGTATSRNF